MTIKIEHNIPIVARGNAKGVTDALRTMKVGDSVFADTKFRANYLFNTLSRAWLSRHAAPSRWWLARMADCR